MVVLCIVVGIPGMCFAGIQNDSTEGVGSCVSIFKNGDYEKAIDCLTLLILYTHNGNDSIAIFKYLGFSYGMLGRIDRAKENFSSALNKQPDLQIDTLECPPNISIIFNQVKLERKIARIDTAVTLAKKVEVAPKKNPLAPILLLTGAVVSAGAGGYYYYSGNTLHDTYRALDTPDQKLLDASYNNFKNAYIKSAVCFGVSAVLLPVATYLFLRKGHSKHVMLSCAHGAPSLVYAF
jgi:tetratricopeptide (TPR) repeat protein